MLWIGTGLFSRNLQTTHVFSSAWVLPVRTLHPVAVAVRGSQVPCSLSHPSADSFHLPPFLLLVPGDHCSLFKVKHHLFFQPFIKRVGKNVQTHGDCKDLTCFSSMGVKFSAEKAEYQPVSELHHVLVVHGADLLCSMLKVRLGWFLPFNKKEKPFCGMWMSLPRSRLSCISSWSHSLYCYLWKWKSLLIKLCLL